MLEFNLSSCHVAYQISATDQMFWFASMLLCFSISLLLCCFICFSASQIQCLSVWVTECLSVCWPVHAARRRHHQKGTKQKTTKPKSQQAKKARAKPTLVLLCFLKAYIMDTMPLSGWKTHMTLYYVLRLGCVPHARDDLEPCVSIWPEASLVSPTWGHELQKKTYWKKKINIRQFKETCTRPGTQMKSIYQPNKSNSLSYNTDTLGHCWVQKLRSTTPRATNSHQFTFFPLSSENSLL